MAGTYSQIYIQVVFAVKGRQNLLQKEWRDDVFKYMSGIIKNKGQNKKSSQKISCRSEGAFFATEESRTFGVETLRYTCTGVRRKCRSGRHFEIGTTF